MDKSDKSLIAEHIQGQQGAFELLVRRYGDSLLGYLVKMTGSYEQAEDVFQETFKRVHEKAHTLVGDQFKGWLYKIATNIAINNFRRSKKLRFTSLNQRIDCDGKNCGQLDSVTVLDNSNNPLDEAIKSERKEKVHQAVFSLPVKQRATLTLAYYQQLSYKEVAEIMGCSIGTVKKQMSRALQTLAQRLPEFSGEMK